MMIKLLNRQLLLVALLPILLFANSEDIKKDRDMQKDKKTVSLVLGSGGARGYAHIGVIESLEAQGYNLEKVIERVSMLLNIEPKEIMRSGKYPQVVAARDLVCCGPTGNSAWQLLNLQKDSIFRSRPSANLSNVVKRSL